MAKITATTPFLTMHETAEHFCVTVTTLYRWVKDKKIPCYKVGRSYRFKKSELELWIQKSKL